MGVFWGSKWGDLGEFHRSNFKTIGMQSPPYTQNNCKKNHLELPICRAHVKTPAANMLDTDAVGPACVCVCVCFLALKPCSVFPCSLSLWGRENLAAWLPPPHGVGRRGRPGAPQRVQGVSGAQIPVAANNQRRRGWEICHEAERRFCGRCYNVPVAALASAR